MKKIIVLIFIIAFSFEMQGQFKTIEPGNSSSTTGQNVVPPASKLNVVRSKNASASFEPKAIEFVKNKENGLAVEFRAKTSKLPIFIKGQPTLNLRMGNDSKSKTYNFLDNAKGLMKIKNPSEEFRIIKSKTDELGFTHVKLQQVIKGIPIYGSEVIYHFSDDESFLNGRYTTTPNIDSFTPSLQQKVAEEIAIEDVGGIMKYKKDKFELFNFEKVKSELVIYEGRLTYHLSVYKNIVDLWEYFIDAHSGEIIHKHSNICKFHNHDSSRGCVHVSDSKDVINSTLMPPPDGPVVSNAIDLFGISREINSYSVSNTFYMIDASKTDMYDAVNSDMPENPLGTVWTIDALNTSPQNDNFQIDHVSSSTSTFSGKQTGVSAQYNGGQAYLYFKNIHGRESINDQGGNVIGLINIADEDGSSLGNAFWNGTAMFYGNGDSSFKPLARGLDVAGHEMSHGVIQSEANLEYQGESGALNESFADVFGSMIDREDWLIGEDVVESSAFPSGALRSLQDPHNGAQTGNFNAGWQPKTYSERFTGSQDNGGVHINSGIPNHAFYLFANDPAVGKNRAEKVYYRALEMYLTKSSQFIDARLAIVQAATDLYGTNVANKAKAAFDEVEIFDGNGTNNQTDVEVNPGSDLILFTTQDQNNIYISDRDGNLIFNPLTEQNPISVPSITDDGSEIIFVNENRDLYYIKIDWANQSIVEEGVLGFSDDYRNVVFSKDGLLMAALRDNADNEIFVFDWVTQSGTNYELFNPTFTEGESTGDVLYADVMEFDFSGEYLMYDAFNEIESTFGDNITYWDVGFIKVFDNDSETFTLGTDIQKLFTQIPEGVSIGNPTFSKNSNYIVAFDYIENNQYDVLGVNTETNDLRAIYSGNDRLGYPNYSNNDDIVIFNGLNSSGTEIIAGAELETNKIESTSASVLLGFEDTGIKWGVWFGNGDRVLADEEIILPENEFSIYPNPASHTLTILSEEKGGQTASLKIIDMMGRTIYSDTIKLGKEKSVDISSLNTGQYVLTLTSSEGRASRVFVKQ